MAWFCSLQMRHLPVIISSIRILAAGNLGSQGSGMLASILSAESGSAARRFFYSSVCWLIVPVFIGLLTATLLYAPGVQVYVPDVLKAALNFGRLRPAHVNIAIFGWLSMAYAGAIYFLTPRLTGASLYSERLANLTLVLWNMMMVGALILLPLGFTQGREYA